MPVKYFAIPFWNPRYKNNKEVIRLLWPYGKLLLESSILFVCTYIAFLHGLKQRFLNTVGILGNNKITIWKLKHFSFYLASASSIKVNLRWKKELSHADDVLLKIVHRSGLWKLCWLTSWKRSRQVCRHWIIEELSLLKKLDVVNLHYLNHFIFFIFSFWQLWNKDYLILQKWV